MGTLDAPSTSWPAQVAIGNRASHKRTVTQRTRTKLPDTDVSKRQARTLCGGGRAGPGAGADAGRGQGGVGIGAGSGGGRAEGGEGAGPG